jgi:hypothetical protein
MEANPTERVSPSENEPPREYIVKPYPGGVRAFFDPNERDPVGTDDDLVVIVRQETPGSGGSTETSVPLIGKILYLLA